MLPLYLWFCSWFLFDDLNNGILVRRGTQANATLRLGSNLGSYKGYTSVSSFSGFIGIRQTRTNANIGTVTLAGLVVDCWLDFSNSWHCTYRHWCDKVANVIPLIKFCGNWFGLPANRPSALKLVSRLVQTDRLLGVRANIIMNDVSLCLWFQTATRQLRFYFGSENICSFLSPML